MTGTGNTVTPGDEPPALPDGSDSVWQRLAKVRGSIRFMALPRLVAGAPPTWWTVPTDAGLPSVLRWLLQGGKAGLPDDPEEADRVARTARARSWQN
jgi:hypothetical protein